VKIAVYPGSFDPVTNGHLDIIERASKIFKKLIVAVIYNPNKNPLFTIEERVEMLKEITKNMENVEVDQFSGLLVHYMKKKEADIIVKGLRMVSDFEYEFQMALMNKKLSNEVETIFMMTNSKYGYVSSSLIKEIARFGGCLKDLVPEVVEKRLKEKFGKVGI